MNQSLEDEVTETKKIAALSSMHNGKIPGPDGFTVEFFKTFYEFLKEYFLLMVREL
jgi:hypothetical protein